MAKIYKSCVEVLAWLGLVDNESDSDTVMEKFKSIGNKAIEAGI